MRKQEKIWTDERREYYAANVGKVKSSHFIELWGCTAASLKKNVYEWRRQGFEFPRGGKLEVGVKVVRKYDGKEYVKCERGWRVANKAVRQKKEKLPKPPKPKKEKQVKVKPRKPIKQRIFKPEKKKEKVFATLQNKETGGRWIRIDSKTIVYKKIA